MPTQEELIEKDMEKLKRYDLNKIEMVGDKYLVSSEDLYKIFLGLLSLEMFGNISISNARVKVITNKSQIIAGLQFYLEKLNAKTDTE